MMCGIHESKAEGPVQNVMRMCSTNAVEKSGEEEYLFQSVKSLDIFAYLTVEFDAISQDDGKNKQRSKHCDH